MQESVSADQSTGSSTAHSTMTSNTDRAAQKREQNRLRSARHRAIKRITMTDDERAEQRENNRLRNIEYRKRKRERTTDEERRTLRRRRAPGRIDIGKKSTGRAFRWEYRRLYPPAGHGTGTRCSIGSTSKDSWPRWP